MEYPGVAVKCADIRKNTGGEGGSLGHTDAEAKAWEQTGLDTLVVHAVNVNTRWGTFHVHPCRS